MAKLVSDIGQDLAHSYAANSAMRDESKTFLEQVSYVPEMVRKDVQLPCKPDEMTLLFQTDLRNKSNGMYNHPEGYNSHKVNLFTHQIMPSGGDKAQFETKLQNVNEQIEKSKGQMEPTDPGLAVLVDQATKLTTGLETVVTFDKVMSDIEGRMGQFKKG